MKTKTKPTRVRMDHVYRGPERMAYYFVQDGNPLAETPLVRGSYDRREVEQRLRELGYRETDPQVGEWTR